MDVVEDDMQMVGVTEDAKGKVKWKQMILCGDP